MTFKIGDTKDVYLHRLGLPFDRLGLKENSVAREVDGCSWEIPTTLNSVHPNNNIQVLDWVLNKARDLQQSVRINLLHSLQQKRLGILTLHQVKSIH